MVGATLIFVTGLRPCERWSLEDDGGVLPYLDITMLAGRGQELVVT